MIGRCFPENEIVPDVGSAEAACGRHVIGKINTYGYAYLRQFAVDRHGVAHRLIVPTAASAVEDLLAGGLETLERKRASAKPVALRDWGEAGLDVVQAPLLVVAGAESLAARDGAMVVREAARRPVLGDAVVRAATSGWVWKTGGVLAVGYEEVGELGCAVQTIAGGQQLSCARLFPDGALAVRRNSRISG